MSQVFVCQCGRKTTDPFIVRDRKLCTVCADDIAPQLVSARERRNREIFARDIRVNSRRYNREI